MLEEPHHPESRAAGEIRRIFESGRPLTYIRSGEEQRVGRLLTEVGRRLFGSPLVWTWSLTEGLRRGQESAITGTQDARKALDFIAGHRGEAIFHLKDFHEPLRDSAEVRRRLRDVYECGRGVRKFIVITSPVAFLPPEIERTTMFLDLRPPDRTELIDTIIQQQPIAILAFREIAPRNHSVSGTGLT